MLAVFAKVVRGETVKSRLQTGLTRQEAERFHVASLADTLETALQLAPAPFLFLQGERPACIEDLRARLFYCGLAKASWETLHVRPQRDGDLGLRLEHAFETLCADTSAPGPALILGSDSPSLPPAYVRSGLARLGLRAHSTPGTRGAGRAEDSARPGGRPHMRATDQHRDSAAAIRPDAPSRVTPVTGIPALGSSSPPAAENEPGADLVLGPTTDGGYWAIGLRKPYGGLLRNIAWSTAHTFADTLARAAAFGLRTELLPLWTDVDRPEDLQALARQIARLRSSGDTRTARHSERFLADIGVHPL